MRILSWVSGSTIGSCGARTMVSAFTVGWTELVGWVIAVIADSPAASLDQILVVTYWYKLRFRLVSHEFMQYGSGVEPASLSPNPSSKRRTLRPGCVQLLQQKSSRSQAGLAVSRVRLRSAHEILFALRMQLIRLIRFEVRARLPATVASLSSYLSPLQGILQ